MRTRWRIMLAGVRGRGDRRRRRRRGRDQPAGAGAVGLGRPATPAARSCPSSNPPNELVLVGGTPQTAQLDTAFANPLQVALANTNGCPVTTAVTGTPVTFTAPASGAERHVRRERLEHADRRHRRLRQRVRADAHRQRHRRAATP